MLECGERVDADRDRQTSVAARPAIRKGWIYCAKVMLQALAGPSKETAAVLAEDPMAIVTSTPNFVSPCSMVVVLDGDIYPNRRGYQVRGGG